MTIDPVFMPYNREDWTAIIQQAKTNNRLKELRQDALNKMGNIQEEAPTGTSVAEVNEWNDFVNMVTSAMQE
jgi:hypothetical protein